MDLARISVSEHYEAIRSLNFILKAALEDDSVSISLADTNQPVVQYYFVLNGVLGNNEYTPSDVAGYGAQQNERTRFSMDEYRQQHGDGQWITEYECIDVEPLRDTSQEKLQQYDIADNVSQLVRPITPESEKPLPETASDSEKLQQALSLLAEFPLEPAATPNQKESELRFPVRDVYENIRSDIGNNAVLDPAELPDQENAHKKDWQSSSESKKGGHSISTTLQWLHDESSHSSEITYEHEQPPQVAQYSDVIPLSKPVTEAVKRQGITSLYEHQKQAIDAATSGEHIVLATETASGKSLPYRLLALDRAYTQNSTTLYIAPTKALINDQAESFANFAESIDEAQNISVEVYTGDTTSKERKRIRRESPDILLMTPELVHTSLLPHNHLWNRFLQSLETVVIDEVHEFRGTFGSHIGLIFRRLNRLLSAYDREPSYFCCSATIGNPVEHASEVTGRESQEFTLINTDTSGRGKRSWLLYNPKLKERDSDSNDSEFGDYPDDWDERRQRVYIRDGYQCRECGKLGGVNGGAELHAHHFVSPSQGGTHQLSNLRTLCADCHSSEHGRPVGRKAKNGDDAELADVPGEVQAGYERRSNHPISIRLFTELVARGHQTLVFTSARQGTAQYTKESVDRLEEMGYSELTDDVFAYHAALQNSEREKIEAGLRKGTVRGVWSTNALELGIDIGSLDAVVIDGHPGTNMSLFQQTGRGGRGKEDCLVLFVAEPSPLDQYCINNPNSIFEELPAEAKTNTNNSTILPDHVVSAADEHHLRIDDETHFGRQFAEIVPDLTEEGRLIRSVDNAGIFWGSSEEETQYGMSLRGDFEIQYELIDQTRSERIGELTFPDVLRDCHPEAIYNYRKRSYRVQDFDETHAEVRLRQIEDSNEFTRPLFNQSIDIKNVEQSKTLGGDESSSVSVGYADLVYQEQLEGYLQYDYVGDDAPTEQTIDEELPDYRLRTKGIYMTIPDQIESRMRTMIDSQEGVLAGVHALEHAVQSIFPLEVLCSTNDIIGLSVLNHTYTKSPTLFILDDISGGAGLTESGYEQFSALLQKAESVIASCDCQSGCPSCIHLSTCQSQNRVLNKGLAGYVLGQLSKDSIDD